MTTPDERVQRLREETTRAALDLLTYCDNGATLDSYVQRWLPETVMKVVDLLETVLQHHVCSGLGPWCQTDQEDWPCADRAAATAVLDALEGA